MFTKKQQVILIDFFRNMLKISKRKVENFDLLKNYIKIKEI